MSSSSFTRLWRSAVLPKLCQGATLSVRADLPATLRIRSGWREDGLACLSQLLSNSKTTKEVTLDVVNKPDRETSIGRVEPHMHLQILEAGNDILPSTTRKSCNHVSSTLVDGKLTTNLDNSDDDHDLFHSGLRGGLLSHVASDSDTPSPKVFLDLLVPEKVNLHCELLKGGSVEIPEKIEGDVHIQTKCGNIAVKKLRGNDISLESSGPDNLVYVSDVLEAQNLRVKTTGRVRAKQIHGNNIEVVVCPDVQGMDFDSVEADDEGSLVDVSSLYISGRGGASILVEGKELLQPQKRSVRVKSHHGPIRVDTKSLGQPRMVNELTGDTFPLVELGGVNGSCEVSLSNVNSLDSSWASCMVHVDSLAEDSVSLVTADSGDISITLDRKAETDLRLFSSSNPDCITETGSLLAEEEDSTLLTKVLKELPPGAQPSPTNRILIETNAFTARPVEIQSEGMEYVDGWTENKSAEPDSRFEKRANVEHGSVGKVRLDGAAQQALKGFTKTSSSDGPSDFRPLVAVVGTRRVKIETVSWLGAIARRYGLNEDNRDLGRTASRRGRQLVAPNSE